MLNTVNFLSLLLFAALAAASLLLKGRRQDAVLPRWERRVLWALILGLCALRLWRFGSVPGGMNQDEAMAAVDAFALAFHGTDRFGTWLPAHFTAWGYGQMSVLLSYCMIPFLRLFGLSALSARLPALLWSFAGMAAFFVFLRRWLGERAALVGLLLLAVNPWHFMQSRWALDCNLFPHLFLLGFALLSVGQKRPWALTLSMLPFALCMYSYGVSFVTVPLFLLLAVWALRVPPRRALGCAAVYFALSWPIYGTMLLNALGRETVSLPFVTLPYFPDSVRAGDILFFSPHFGAQLWQNARSLWRVGFLQAPDLIWNAIDGFGTVYRCSMPLLCLGLVHTLREARRSAEARLVLLYWLCSLWLGLCINNVNVNRLNILFYANLLLIARGAEGLLGFRRETAAALAASYALLAGLFFGTYFTDWAARIEPVFYADFLDALRYAETLGAAEYEITPDSQFTGSRQTSEILTLFAHRIDALYFQSEAYAARYHYRNPPMDSLTDGTVCVRRRGAALPEGWTEVDFGQYGVYFKEGEHADLYR